MSNPNRKNAPKSPAEVSAELGSIARAIMGVQVDIDFGKITTRDELQAASRSLLKAMERLSEAKSEMWRSLSATVTKPHIAEGAPMPYDPIAPIYQPEGGER